MPGVHVEPQLHEQAHRRSAPELSGRQHRVGTPCARPRNDVRVGRSARPHRIAVSRETLMQLEANLPLVHAEGPDSRLMEYFDEQIGRRLVFQYAGNAKFKGVRSSFPVYEVSFGV